MQLPLPPELEDRCYLHRIVQRNGFIERHKLPISRKHPSGNWLFVCL